MSEEKGDAVKGGLHIGIGPAARGRGWGEKKVLDAKMQDLGPATRGSELFLEPE